MKKRIFSILLTLIMVVGLMPSMAWADPTEVVGSTTHTNHCVCCGSATIGDHNSHSNVEFKAWDDSTAAAQNTSATAANSLPSTAGNYYLTTNVTISATWQPPSGTVLCLNGYNITKTTADDESNKAVIAVASGSTFTLTDCKGTTGGYGKITHTTNIKGRGIYNEGTFNMYGGNIAENVIEGQGGGVYNLGTFKMYDGSISGNKVEVVDGSGSGGGVYNLKQGESAGNFNMYGGTISENTALNGGGVYSAYAYCTSGGTFAMSGGSITENTATNSGGGVDNVGCIFNMTGGTIGGSGTANGNTAGNGGGGVSNAGNFTMQNAQIIGNKVANSSDGAYGGGVCNSGTFTMNEDSRITGNNASSTSESVYGGGVYNDRCFNMNASSSVISGNTAATTAEGKSSYGGGVCNRAEYTGNGFKMEAGAIFGNSAATGGGVYTSGSYFTPFIMSGGEITGNNATTEGGGVYKASDDCTMTVSGAVKIKDNWLNGTLSGSDNKYVQGPGTANNLCLAGQSNSASYATFTIGEALTGGNGSIGISKPAGNGLPETNSYVIISKLEGAAYSPIDGDMAALSLDVGGSQYSIKKTTNMKNLSGVSANGAIIAIVNGTLPHTHSWTYSLSTTTTSNDTITATCSTDDCTLTDKKGGSVTIATPTAPAGGVLTYDGDAKEATLNKDSLNSDITVPTISYQVKDSSDNFVALPSGTTAPTNAGTYKASITLGDKTASVEYTIGKAAPTCVAPTVTATYGQKLSDLTWTNPSGNTAGIWTWTDATQSVGNVGSNTFTAKFTPTDTTNYKTVESVDVTVTVGKANQTITVPSDKVLTKNGTDVDISSWATLSQGDGTLSYSLDGTYTEITLEGTTLTADSTASEGTITIKVNAAETTNYNAAEEKTITVRVSSKTSANFTTIAMEGWTYGDEQKTVSYTPNDTGGTATLTYAVKDSADYSTTVPTNAGTYTVKVVLETDDKIYIGTDDFTISPKSVDGDSGITVINIAPVTYNGNAQTPEVTVKDGEKTLVKDTDYTVTYSDNTNVGEAKATITFKGNYSGTIEKTFTINPASTPSSGKSHSSKTAYTLTAPEKSENGTIELSTKSASRDTIVTVTVKPDNGYKLDKLTVADSDGNQVKLTNQGDNKYNFAMPASSVDVKATFVKEADAVTPVEVSLFTDVATNAYYYQAVKWASGKNIASGTGNGLFEPDQICTRAQIVTFLWRAAGSPEPKALSSFTDVATDAYYAKAVAWAVENSITTGTSVDKFSPNDYCTRAQAVTFLARALNGTAQPTSEFTDVPADSYYASAVAWAKAKGITTGITEAQFAPDDYCTRAQIVTFIYRAYK